ncbi:MAG TPA: hypothetical protein VMX94_04135 [Armatimonadota bacterium]|nr:hypothetical protein [Armatimonadota bacterium]
MSHHEDQAALEEALNSFDPEERGSALEELASQVRSGKIAVPAPREEVNLHYHTFFSFNANNWSPSRIAWEGRKYGLEVAGVVDFDVLDGMEEFLSAGELLGSKTVAGMETRVFIKELEDKVMSSPNEPGIAYFMAAGCFKRPPAGSAAEHILKSMAETAHARNMALMARVNAYLDEVQLDYEPDVIPLTPSGNATERHLLAAYDRRARQIFGGDVHRVAAFWSDKLEIPQAEVGALIADTPKFHEKIRSKLMKFGGIGYVSPDSGSFPTIEDAIEMICSMCAFPMIAWLDGTNPGEEDTDAFLKLLREKGVIALNIIPDRNWNIKNPDEKALKTRKLREVVEAAGKFDMPISVGTEMNKAGLPFVDKFSAPELLPYVNDFVEGARIFYGHTLLARYADFGYFSEGSQAAFGGDAAARNKFYADVGRVPVPSAETRIRLAELAGRATPALVLSMLRA